jgi:hypothetical protein
MRSGVNGRAIRQAHLAWAVMLLLGAAQVQAQIVFKSIDPRKMGGIIPLQKPIQPSRPSLPNPRLHTQNIRPDRIQFSPIEKDDMLPENLRPQRLMPDLMPKDGMVQQPIAPAWLRREAIGPERLTPEALPARESFRYRSPIFMPATRPRPGFDDSMKLTPSLFSDRPIDPSRAKVAPRAGQGASRPASAVEQPRYELGW